MSYAKLMLTPTESEDTRLLAHRYLLNIDNGVHRHDLGILISEASNISLNIVAETIEALGLETFERTYLAEFFRVCSKLCERRDRSLGYQYSLKQFINRLDLATIEWLLDDLTKDLACSCGKEPYECDCRNGISKIVGSMLDRYFGISNTSI